MGLDIYLYEYDDFAATRAAEQEYEQISEKIWDKFDLKYEHMTDAQKNECRDEAAAVATRMGLGEYGEDEARKRKIELDSKTDPKHLFKIGYFRSSYNEGGINSQMDTAIGKDLYWVFDRTRDDDYEFRPDWARVKARALQCVEQWKAKFPDGKPLRVMRIETRMGFTESPKIDAADALNIVQKMIAERKPDNDFGNCFSNRDGLFLLDEEPIHFLAFIPGLAFGRDPCVYGVYRDDAEGVAWYWNALNIIAETCDYVLSQPDPQKFYVHWSG